MLNILEPFDLKKLGAGSVEARHLMAEAMRRAFADRARYLGDPGFTKVPEFLTTNDHARKLAADIDPAKATKSEDIAKDIPLTEGPTSTTHFSVIDKDGMAVSNTYTLEENYGSRVVVRGAGYILNNEMGDFNTRPGVTTRKGRIGTEPNLVAPGKRMLSSMTPTIIAKGGKVYLVTGSPGGRTIINTVLCVVTNVIDFEMDVRAAVDYPRQHHQWFPDELRLESPDPTVVSKLEAMGHVVKTHRQGRPLDLGRSEVRRVSRGGGQADQRKGGRVLSDHASVRHRSLSRPGSLNHARDISVPPVEDVQHVADHPAHVLDGRVRAGGHVGSEQDVVEAEQGIVGPGRFGSNTSMAAPATSCRGSRPLPRGIVRTSPRLVLIRIAVGFISAQQGAPTRALIAGPHVHVQRDDVGLTESVDLSTTVAGIVSRGPRRAGRCRSPACRSCARSARPPADPAHAQDADRQLFRAARRRARRVRVELRRLVHAVPKERPRP